MKDLDEKAKNANRYELIISDLKREVQEKTTEANLLMEKAAIA